MHVYEVLYSKVIISYQEILFELETRVFSMSIDTPTGGVWQKRIPGQKVKQCAATATVKSKRA